MSYFLEKQKTASTPYILIDEAHSYMKFEGKSFPEKAGEFFTKRVKNLSHGNTARSYLLIASAP